jgi:hypothetical protein
MRKSLKIILIAFAFLFLALISPFPVLSIFKIGKTSLYAELKSRSMREGIRAEIKTLPNHEWAGEYYAGDGLGRNVSLAIFKTTAVTINLGRNQRLATGMELYVTDPDSYVTTVKLTRVENEESEGIIRQIGPHFLEPKVGWKLSTHAPWRN